MASSTQTIQVLKLWCLQAEEDRKAVEIFHKKLKNLRKRHRRRKIIVMTLMVLMTSVTTRVSRSIWTRTR